MTTSQTLSDPNVARRTSNPDFLNGVPELLLLRLLSRQPMYGYQLVQSIKIASNERLKFGEGSIYPVLHRLEAEGCLKSREETVSGRARVVYDVTTKGQKRLVSSVAAWERVSSAIESVLAGAAIRN